MMTYTVKKLAQLSGVSIRTLHYYDEIGLLKPAYYGNNNYRYYDEEQLLILQQILFFRDLGFPLSDIKRIILSSDFDKVNALKSHRVVLKKALDQKKKLIKTIDKTIAYLGGNLKMSHEEMYYGFDSEQQQAYEKKLVEKGISQAVIDNSRSKVKHWKKEDWDNYKEKMNQLNKELVAAMQNGLAPEAEEVQALVNQHYQMIKIFWAPTKESYIALGQMYFENADFNKFYHAYDPNLLKFLVAAMEIFANDKLS